MACAGASLAAVDDGESAYAQRAELAIRAMRLAFASRGLSSWLCLCLCLGDLTLRRPPAYPSAHLNSRAAAQGARIRHCTYLFLISLMRLRAQPFPDIRTPLWVVQGSRHSPNLHATPAEKTCQSSHRIASRSRISQPCCARQQRLHRARTRTRTRL